MQVHDTHNQLARVGRISLHNPSNETLNKSAFGAIRFAIDALQPL